MICNSYAFHEPFGICKSLETADLKTDTVLLPLKSQVGSGAYWSTSNTVLDKLKGSHPVIDTLLEYQSRQTLLSRYYSAENGYAKHIAADGR